MPPAARIESTYCRHGAVAGPRRGCPHRVFPSPLPAPELTRHEPDPDGRRRRPAPASIDRTRGGGITIQGIAYRPHRPGRRRNLSRPRVSVPLAPWARTPRQGRPARRSPLLRRIWRTRSRSAILLGPNYTSRVWTGALDTSTFDGRTTPGDVDTGDISHDGALVGVLAGRNAGNSGLLGTTRPGGP